MSPRNKGFMKRKISAPRYESITVTYCYLMLRQRRETTAASRPTIPTRVNALAIALRVPATRIGAIVKGKRAVTEDTALRLARFFGMTAEFWINLQAQYDLRQAKAALKTKLAKIMPMAA